MRWIDIFSRCGFLFLAIIAGACEGTQQAVTSQQPDTPATTAALLCTDSYSIGTLYYENELYITTDYPFTIESSRLDQVESGMTLRELVALLGKGWMRLYEGCGIITWQARDGRKLTVWPRTYELDEITTGGELGSLRLRAPDGTALSIPERHRR